MFCIIYDAAAEDARSAPPLCLKTGIGSWLDHDHVDDAHFDCRQGLFWPQIFVREKIPFGQKQWEIFKFSEIFFFARLDKLSEIFFLLFFSFCKGQILYQNCMYKYYYCLFFNVL